MNDHKQRERNLIEAIKAQCVNVREVEQQLSELVRLAYERGQADADGVHEYAVTIGKNTDIG